ncbi:hypothetical protein K438DRAFT_1778977 [Mycena galopus ATCC 62051]|nr:hypothetical protein K438DRAFT_1778977 [Mycena galopus ATCC 62051]
MMELCASRPGSLPLNYFLDSCNPKQGRLFVEAAMRHHVQWGLLHLSIPSVSCGSLHTLANASFPLLHRLELVIPQPNWYGGWLETPHTEYSNRLIIRNAPKLRRLQIAASKYYSEFPAQLEGPLGVVIENHKWAEGLSRLILCTNLTELTDFAKGPDTPISLQITGHDTMPFLQWSISRSAPRSRHAPSSALAQPCPLQDLTLALRDPEFLRSIMALALSIVNLRLWIQSDTPEILGVVGTALRPEVLPILQILNIQYSTESLTGATS